ncbi:MAG: ATP-binding protein, partial [Nocardioides sp.]|uniref:ATP-binding protein n=1 Tax=Nocardioides sp. TaxID=35761 RepID=UPI003266BBC8
PLVTAASITAVEGLLLVALAVLEMANLTGGRVTLGLTTAVFFAAFGVLSSEAANALAMVLTELLQNAVEHGYAVDGLDTTTSPGVGEIGEIVLGVQTSSDRRLVTLDDDGRGLPDGFVLDDSTSLGLSIVRTLVESELGGHLEIGGRPGGPGTVARIDVPMD